MNKYISKDVGINAISSYKRASNITDKVEREITGRPDAVLFRTEEEKILFENFLLLNPHIFKYLLKN